MHSPFELDAAEAQLVDLFARAIRESSTVRGGLSASALAAFAVRALAAAADVSRTKVRAVARLVLEAVT